MAPTFALQPIPPFKPKQQPTLPSLPNTLAQLSDRTAAASDPRAASSEVGRASLNVSRAQERGEQPIVYELPNPARARRTKRKDPQDPSGRMDVSEGDEALVRKSDRTKKRRASAEMDGDLEGERAEAGSRRGSGESQATSSNDGVRPSFSIPANPHPRATPPGNRSPPLRESSPSPHAQREQHVDLLSSKRARTTPHPLDSLATTASNLLATSSAPSAPLPSALAGQPHAQHKHTSLTFDHLAALEATQQIREQQQREIERRRLAAGGTKQPQEGSLGAALHKLNTQQATSEAVERTASADRETILERGADAAEPTGTGLAKRRGHRPPAVATAPYSTTTTIANGLPRPSYEEAMRSAPPGIPSVLVGSPVEASWAAKVGKEAGVGAARHAGVAQQAPNGQAQRRQSTAGSAPYPSVREPAPPRHHRTSLSQSYPRGSDSYRHYSHQTGALHPPSASDRNLLNPPHSASFAPSPQSHPLSLSHSSGGVPLNPGPRLPPLNLVHPRSIGPGHAPSPASSSYAHLSHHSQSQPPSTTSPPFSYGTSSASHTTPSHPSHSNGLPSAGPPPPSSSPSNSSVSSSKAAFLSLFSTFFDSLQDSRVLTNTLDAQIARSATLLSTLQQSEAALERLVDRRIGQAQAQWASDAHALEARLARLEDRVAAAAADSVDPGANGFVGLGISQPAGTTTSSRESPDSTATMSSSHLEARMARLEDALSRSGSRSALRLELAPTDTRDRDSLERARHDHEDEGVGGRRSEKEGYDWARDDSAGRGSSLPTPHEESERSQALGPRQRSRSSSRSPGTIAVDRQTIAHEQERSPEGGPRGSADVVAVRA
ncbi:hypothetical protein JCM10212_005279 [Sporobolomyces blumeae]